MQKCYQNERRFNGPYSRNNLSKIKDRAYIINIDEYESIGSQWIFLFVNSKQATYFEGFGVERIPKEIRTFIGNRNIITNIYRIQTYNSVTCGYFYIAFIDFMLKGKCLLECINLFSPDKKEEWQNNIKIFSKEPKGVKMMKVYCNVSDKYRKIKNSKDHTVWQNG